MNDEHHNANMHNEWGMRDHPLHTMHNSNPKKVLRINIIRIFLTSKSLVWNVILPWWTMELPSLVEPDKFKLNEHEDMETKNTWW